MRVVLPAARVGLITAAVLGIARTAGETAEVLFTAGGSAHYNWNPLHGWQDDLPFRVYEQVFQPSSQAISVGWGAAFVLVALVLILFTLARVLGSGRSGSPRRSFSFLRRSRHCKRDTVSRSRAIDHAMRATNFQGVDPVRSLMTESLQGSSKQRRRRGKWRVTLLVGMTPLLVLVLNWHLRGRLTAGRLCPTPTTTTTSTTLPTSSGVPPPVSERPFVTPVGIAGTGSSFASPAVTNWTDEVWQSPYNLSVNYTPSNSGQGRYEFTNGTVDYAVSDTGYVSSSVGTTPPSFPLRVHPDHGGRRRLHVQHSGADPAAAADQLHRLPAPDRTDRQLGRPGTEAEWCECQCDIA